MLTSELREEGQVGSDHGGGTSCSGENLLGYYAASSVNFLLTFGY